MLKGEVEGKTINNGKVGYVVPVNEKEIALGIIDFYELGREEEFHLNIAREKFRFSWKGFVNKILFAITQS